MHIPAWGFASFLALLVAGCPGQTSIIQTPVVSPPSDGGSSLTSCLPQRSLDLVQYLRELPFVGRDGGPMIPVSRGTTQWMSAYSTALAWASADCPSFMAYADAMGYKAEEITDTVTQTRHWVLTERASRWNGFFVLRAPSEVAKARPLTITAPHLGYDFGDDRALILYRELGALGLLQNTAHRCNLATCSGCTAFAGYACSGCPRASDLAHSVDHLMFALFSGLEAMHKVVRFEYHGAAEHQSSPDCSSTVNLSQGTTEKLPPEVDDKTPASRMWKALERSLGPRCVCYHQRESACVLPGTNSVFGRLTNQEPTIPFDPCTTAAARSSGRFIHFEGQSVAVERVIAALSEAVPMPTPRPLPVVPPHP
ncbi:MAG TPA: hypothetical protein PKI49_07305 [Pseudomonadota bacterium]|nr:hypothetical protein [Pseudomonadota bacterium]